MARGHGGGRPSMGEHISTATVSLNSLEWQQFRKNVERCFPGQSAIKRLRLLIKRDNAEMTGNEAVTADEIDLVNQLIKLKNRATKIPRNLQEARSDFAVRQKTEKRVAMLRMRF